MYNCNILLDVWMKWLILFASCISWVHMTIYISLKYLIVLSNACNYVSIIQDRCKFNIILKWTFSLWDMLAIWDGRLVCKCTCGLGDSVFSTGVWDHYRREASHLPECVLPADEENPQRLWAVCLPQRGGWEHQTQLAVSQRSQHL